MRVKLNGGPLHGKEVHLPEGRQGLRIAEAHADGESVKYGYYSQVSMKPGEFEWDGWVKHD